MEHRQNTDNLNYLLTNTDNKTDKYQLITTDKMPTNTIYRQRIFVVPSMGSRVRHSYHSKRRTCTAYLDVTCTAYLDVATVFISISPYR